MSFRGSMGRLLLDEVQCCFTSTKTIRDGEPRTATSTFTQLLGSDWMKE